MIEIIPNNYPNGLNDQELLQKIQELQDIAATRSREKNAVIDGFFENLVQMGNSEMLVRLQKEQLKINKSTKITAFAINVASIVMLIASLFIAYDTRRLAKADQTSDQIWMIDQINELKKTNLELMELNKNLSVKNVMILPDYIANKMIIKNIN